MKLTRERPWARWYGRLILIGLFTWLLLIGGMTARAGTDSALQVTPHSHDFGAVKRLGGDVHTTFMVHNQGDTPIKIRRIWTSGPCTTATLVVAQRQSPTFDMFNNHPKWSETLKAGEEGTLLVSFDPNYHGPEGVGLQQKAIRITTGDIRKPLAEIRLTATVVDEPGAESIPGSPDKGSHGRKERHGGGPEGSLPWDCETCCSLYAGAASRVLEPSPGLRLVALILRARGAPLEALRAVGRALMRNHLRHCATQALATGSPEQAEAMYDELLNLIYKHSR